MKRILFETDWLASRPVFYNEKTGKASYCINDVIEYSNLELHPEGFNNYLDFGYSILEQTPVKHVKFLRHSSRLWRDDQGALKVEYLDDPVEKLLDYRLSEKDIFDLIRDSVQKWERSVEGEIIIPTSGGYDSRILNWCIGNKSRIRAFTYGISDNQSESYEVVYAKRLSEIFNTKWEQIPLGDYHKYLDDWDKLFGVSAHAHGMYHFEFYDKIKSKISGGNPFLSGIFGDVWAGSTNPPALQSFKDLNLLGYTHGLNAEISKSNYSPEYILRKHFFEENGEKLGDERYRVITQIRLKMILISYLLTVPIYFGFKPWSPFLDISLCMAMLNLPPERRSERLWQKEFFQKAGLDLESMNLKASRQNSLDLQAQKRIRVKPLDVDLLKEALKADYIEWINRNLTGSWYSKILDQLIGIRKVGGGLKRLGFGEPRQLDAYNAYLVLLPVENLFRRRIEA